MRRFNLDPWLFILILILIGLGLIMVLSSSFAISQKKYHDPYFLFKRQLIYAMLGIAMMVIASNIPYQFYYNFTYPLLFLCLTALLLVFVPGLGCKLNYASRWIKIGHFTIQPSEFLKLTMIMYLARALTRDDKLIKSFSYGILPPFIIYTLVAIPLLKEPDMGTAVLLAGVMFIMLFIGGARIKHLLIVMGLAMVGFAYLIIKTPYRFKRFLAFWQPEQYPLGIGYPILHSKIAFITGGIFGKGLGASKEKLFYLPEPYSDYVFSILGEELGFLGVALIVGLFVLFVFRGIEIARGARDVFGFYLTLGIVFLIVLQAVIHIGGCLGLIPPKGITLPFVSYGGSSLIANLIAIGILHNIYAQGKR